MSSEGREGWLSKYKLMKNVCKRISKLRVTLTNKHRNKNHFGSVNAIRVITNNVRIDTLRLADCCARRRSVSQNNIYHIPAIDKPRGAMQRPPPPPPPRPRPPSRPLTGGRRGGGRPGNGTATYF